MGVAKRPAKKAKPAPSRSTAAPAKPLMIVNPEDVSVIVGELASTLAPADVQNLLEHEQQLRQHVRGLSDVRLKLLREQVELALDCLKDHIDGRAPQIPYHTISALAAGISYFSQTLDVIPDFLPEIGRMDDAVVLAVAFELAEAGVRRYCDWTGRDADRFFRKFAGSRM